MSNPRAKRAKISISLAMEWWGVRKGRKRRRIEKKAQDHRLLVNVEG